LDCLAVASVQWGQIERDADIIEMPSVIELAALGGNVRLIECICLHDVPRVSAWRRVFELTRSALEAMSASESPAADRLFPVPSRGGAVSAVPGS
jgi:hypothetical protein